VRYEAVEDEDSRSNGSAEADGDEIEESEMTFGKGCLCGDRGSVIADWAEVLFVGQLVLEISDSFVGYYFLVFFCEKSPNRLAKKRVPSSSCHHCYRRLSLILVHHQYFVITALIAFFGMAVQPIRVGYS
jgi:hypothetical protein